jgi:hypothetical protein
MVEQWKTNISYTNYFGQCAPISCIFSKVERHNFVYVLSTLLSLLGGLTLILKLVIPTTVRLVQRWKNTGLNLRIPRKSNMYSDIFQKTFYLNSLTIVSFKLLVSIRFHQLKAFVDSVESV